MLRRVLAQHVRRAVKPTKAPAQMSQKVVVPQKDGSMQFGGTWAAFLRRYTTLVEVQNNSCKSFGDRPFIGDRKGDDFVWKTYNDFEKDQKALSAALHQLGVNKDDSVAVISTNRYEWAVGNYACLHLGAKWVPMYENQTSEDWEHIIKDSGTSLVFVSRPEVAGRLVRHWETLKNNDNTVALPRIVLFDGPSAGTHEEDSVLPNVVNYADVIKLGKSGKKPSAKAPSPDDIATIIYTSGTTGKPKGVMLSHKNIVHNLKAMKQIAAGHYDKNTVHCAILPWAHAYGQTVELHQAMNNGASIGTSSAATVLADLKEIKPTILVGVPQVFGRLYDRITSQLDNATGIRKSIANLALSAAEERRSFLDSADRVSTDAMGRAVAALRLYDCPASFDCCCVLLAGGSAQSRAVRTPPLSLVARQRHSYQKYQGSSRWTS